MLQAISLLIVGIILLVWAGDWLVRGAAALARHWGVPALVVGLTIVAFGTSAPEMIVGIQAALKGSGNLAAGNIIGSNIANVLLALGAPALILAIPTNMAGVARNSGIALAATIAFIILIFLGNPLVFWQGAVLFAGIILYLAYMFRLAKTGSEDPILQEMTEIDEGQDGLPTNIGISTFFILFGLIGLFIGGKLIVDNAIILASALGISETIIGLTIVAIGTSLPEVATVIIAAWRGQPGVAIGNVLGSNVFNLLAVGGASAIAGPILIEPGLMVFDIWVMLIAMIVLLIFVLKRAEIGRKTGMIFLLAYILYLAALVRGVL